MLTFCYVLRPYLLPVLLGVLLSLAVPARAATLNVPAQYPTIQAAITASHDGDTVLVADGAYSGAGNRDIDFGGKNLTVTSQNGAAKTIIDCGGSASADGSGNHRGFYLHSGETAAVITGFTIKNGSETYFSSIPDSDSGGGICIHGSSATIQNCVITGCNATSGGGVYNGNSRTGGTITLTNCTLTENVAYAGGGGGVYNHNSGGTITLTNCILTRNAATAQGGNGGGVYNDNSNGGSIMLTNCTFTNNGAGLYGGGGGGGVYNDNSGGTVTLTSCTLTRNTAGRSDVVGNRDGNGGGVYNAFGPITLTNCALINNIAGNGGGVWNGSGPIALTNCTLANNVAYVGSGGGVYNNSGGFYNNNSGDTLTLTNDILYGDTGGEIVKGPQNSVSLLVSYCDVQGGYAGTGDLDADPHFVNPPANLHLFNAPTDLHPQRGSPCLGAGTSTGAPPTDFDSTARPNPPSIGAYEVAAAAGHTHILWNNPDGRVILWSLAADGSFTYHVFGPYTDDGTANTPWHAAALATGPDGKSHILWTNPDGRVILWTVDDAGNFTYAAYGPYQDGAPNTPWSAKAISMGADNVVHILWTNPDHRVILWNVDAAFNFTNALFGPYDDGAPNTFWNAMALATGPDNVTRLLWNNPDGRVILWNVNSAFGFTYHVFGPYNDGSPNTPWSASAVSVGPDNMTHLLWNNPDMRVILLNVDSAFGFTNALFGPYTDGAPNTPWNATALATGPDGLSHLLWTNPDNRVFVWGVDSTFHFTNVLYGPYTDGAPQNIWSATAISAGP